MVNYIFGDSFIGPFTLLEEEDYLKVHMHNKTTMKGITNKDNKIRNSIIDIIQTDKYKISNVLFGFGHIDLFFNHYKIFVNNGNHDIKKIVKRYIQFIDSLDINNSNKYVLSLYPSTIKDEFVFDALKHYKVLTEEEINNISLEEQEHISSRQYRYDLYRKFNDLLKFYCKSYNIKFINLENYIMTNDNLLKSSFINTTNNLNIHLLWEPLIPIIVKSITFINNNYKINLKDSQKKFLNFKKQKYIQQGIKNLNI